LFEPQHMIQGDAVLPSSSFEIRLCCEVIYITETEVGDWDDVRWDIQHFLKSVLIENTYPSDTNSFRASRNRVANSSP
jgi:hypothetical protein